MITKRTILKKCCFEPFLFEMIIKTVLLPQSKQLHKYLLLKSASIKHNFYFRLTYYILYWSLYYPTRYLLKALKSKAMYLQIKIKLGDCRVLSLFILYSYLNSYTITSNGIIRLSIWETCSPFNFWTIHSFILTLILTLYIIKFRH